MSVKATQIFSAELDSRVNWVYFAGSGREGGCLLDKTIGVALTAEVGLGVDGPSFELDDERCGPADCVGALESVRPDVVVVCRTAYLDGRASRDVLEGLEEPENSGPICKVSLCSGKYWRLFHPQAAHRFPFDRRLCLSP